MSTEKLPRGLRNNNPGNIRNNDSINWQGEVAATSKKDFTFEEFKDRASGYRALLKLLRNYVKRLQITFVVGPRKMKIIRSATLPV